MHTHMHTHVHIRMVTPPSSDFTIIIYHITLHYLTLYNNKTTTITICLITLHYLIYVYIYIYIHV